MAFTQTQPSDERRELRQEVLHRTRIAQANGVERSVTLVNVSPSGFMARADGEWAAGDVLTAILPVVGLVKAEVRWALGGRIGCRLLRTIRSSEYDAMLRGMLRSI